MKLVERILMSEGCLASLIFLIFLLFCVFNYFPYGSIIGLSVYFWRSHLLKAKHAQIKENSEKERIKYANERYQKFLNTPQWQRLGFSSEEAYLAEKERVIRKTEQDYFLARAYKQRQQLSKVKKNLASIEDLFKFTPIEFEKWVKHHVFEKEGWIVTETKTTGDGGVDLILNRKDERSIAQCKRYRDTVGEPLLRDFYGTMVSEGVSVGYFVTTGLFSLSAQKFVQNKPIEMIDRRVLAQKYL